MKSDSRKTAPTMFPGLEATIPPPSPYEYSFPVPLISCSKMYRQPQLRYAKFPALRLMITEYIIVHCIADRYSELSHTPTFHS